MVPGRRLCRWRSTCLSGLCPLSPQPERDSHKHRTHCSSLHPLVSPLSPGGRDAGLPSAQDTVTLSRDPTFSLPEPLYVLRSICGCLPCWARSETSFSMDPHVTLLFGNCRGPGAGVGWGGCDGGWFSVFLLERRAIAPPTPCSRVVTSEGTATSLPMRGQA